MSFWNKIDTDENHANGKKSAPGRINGMPTKRTLIVVAAGAAIIAVLLMAWQVIQILLLVFLSLLLALFLRALSNFISQHISVSVAWSLALVVLVLMGAVALILLLYGPDIADGFYQLFHRLPSAPERLRSTLDRYDWGPELMDALSRAGHSLTELKQLSKIAGIFSTVFGALGSVVIVMVLGLFFAAAPKTYIDGCVRLFPSEHRERVREVFDRIGHALRWWLFGRIAGMLAVGTMTAIGLAIMGMPFTFILSLIAAVLDFVPNIGPLISAVPAVIIGFTQSGATALYVIILYLVVQSLESYLIIPYIQQRVVFLPPALLLIAQLMMGAGLGILGLLLASPLTVVVMVLVRMLYMRDVLKEQVKLP